MPSAVAIIAEIRHPKARNYSAAAVVMLCGTVIAIVSVLRGQSTRVPVSRPCRSRVFEGGGPHRTSGHSLRRPSIVNLSYEAFYPSYRHPVLLFLISSLQTSENLIELVFES
jgi:hypothetical protein